jgi:hypothetical protein
VLAVDVVSPCQIAPGSIDNLHELSVGDFLLRLVHTVRFTEHLIEIRYDCCITELGEVTDVDLHISCNPEVVMHDQHAGAGFFTVRVRYIAGDAIFLGRKVAVNDLHCFSPPSSVSISRWIKP